MKQKMKLSFLLIQLSIATSAIAANSSVPTELLYAGKPIDSLCFANIENNNAIDLRQCGATKEKYTVKGPEAEMTKKGYIGYVWLDKSFSPGAQGYTYYHYYPASNNKFWIYTANNTGGSGDFTNVYLVQRKDTNTIVVEGIAGGDRCNGGVENVSEKNNKLTFSVNLTAYDFVNVTDKKLSGINAYDDLAACAVCCVAKGFYTVEAGGKAQLDYVQLDKITDAGEMPDQGKYQACFNKLYVDFVNKNGTKLNEDKTKDFIGQFEKTCVSNQ